MKILCDIGGTYARFAQVQGGKSEAVRKYVAAEFPDLQSALAQYCRESGLKTGGDLAIATAGYNDASVWKFVNHNKWQINPDDLKAAGWNIQCILNDFEAATWSLLSLREDEQTVLKEGKAGSDTLCLLGPGTGLGLGYLHKSPAPFVQKTHGGHMPAAAISAEQWAAIQELQNTQKTVVVFENLVSGPGLQKLRDVYDSDKALRLFHEFLGLFAANAVVTGHAYGGLYLTGGVLERLIEEDLFDFAGFEKSFCLNAVSSVARDLKATPIIYITEPYPALKGLLNA